MTDKKISDYDVVILGSGPAGFSSAIYSARGNLKTAIIDINMFGGQPSNYLEIENYPGFPIISGYELMEEIETTDTIFKAKAVIIATGAQAKKLNIKGETEFIGRGVSYCAVCDGAFYKDKIIAVIGGGNSALEEAMYLTKFAKKVYLIHRRETFRADKIVCQRACKNEKIEFIMCAQPIEIIGNQCVEKLILKDLKNNKNIELCLDGVFPYIGYTPNVDNFIGQVEQNSEGFIETNINMQTSLEGVYAAGDVRNTPLRQVVTAASDGAVAATCAVKYIESLTQVTV